MKFINSSSLICLSISVFAYGTLSFASTATQALTSYEPRIVCDELVLTNEMFDIDYEVPFSDIPHGYSNELKSKTKLLQVGQIISSSRFVSLTYVLEWIENRLTKRVFEFQTTQRDRDPNSFGKYNSVDESRASAKFVVTKAEANGGSQSARYPNGWSVTVKRLNANDELVEPAETISFYQTGFFSDEFLVFEDEIKIWSPRSDP